MDQNRNNSLRHQDLPTELNRLTERVIGAALEVHRVLGPGLVEKIYEEAMMFELSAAGISFERQVVIRVPYRTALLSTFRLDLLVARQVILELKAVEKLHESDPAKLVSYLRAADLPIGLIINFHHQLLRDGITRRVNRSSSLLRPLPPPSVSANSAPSAFTSIDQP